MPGAINVAGPPKGGLYRFFAACLLPAFAAAAAAGQTRQSDVAVRTSIDRTALFAGDRVTYTIELTCAPGVEVLGDDLSRDKLKLEGLEAIESESQRQPGPDGATFRFRYMLTTYRVDAPSLRIAPITVRYALLRAGQRIEEAAPAGEIQVPGAALAFRSVLADDEPADIRSGMPPDPPPARYALVRSIGIGLVIVSIVPVAIAGAAVVRRTRRPRARSMRAVRHDSRLALDAVQTMAIDTSERRREVFTRLDAIVRQHLCDACGVPGHSLTPPEIPRALAANGRHPPAELVASVLATCEQARYAPAHAMPSADACRQAIQQVEQVIAGA